MSLPVPGRAYLSTPAALAMAKCDTQLVVSDTRFPVHRSFICACSSTLAELLQEYEGTEVTLFPAPPRTPGRPSPPEAAGPTPQWMASPSNFATFLLHIYSSARQAATPASEQQARLLVEMSDYWGAPCLLPACDAFLAMHLRTQKGAVMERRPAADLAGGFTYLVSGERLRPYLELASRHHLRRLMAECLPFLWELDRDEAAPLVLLLDGAVTAALCQFIFSRKREHQPASGWSCGCRDCGGVRHVAFDVPVGTGTFVHRCTDCKLRIRSQRRMMADEVEESLAAQGWGRSS